MENRLQIDVTKKTKTAQLLRQFCQANVTQWLV